MLRRLLLAVLFGMSYFTACPASEAQPVPKRVDAVDVVVAGGGSAGVPAAVQAARMGAKTVLVEAGFQIG
ncbi:MAG: FAD-dependent oxidoreductase, partial [Thermoguttaceae bacterium]